MDLTSYFVLFPACTRNKPRFMANVTGSGSEAVEKQEEAPAQPQRTKAFTPSLPHSSAPAVVLLAGQVADREALLQAGFAHVVAITPVDMPLSMALQPQVARHNIIETIKHINL